MFDFDESSCDIKRIKTLINDYDIDLGIALSKSLQKEPGSLILSPEEVQKIINNKIENL